MPKSKCPKCDATEFAMETISLKNSKTEVVAIQCEICGSVVGVIPDFNSQSAHNSLLDKIKNIDKNVNNIGNIVDQINKRIATKL